ncbi:MAG: hypothetical protein RJQ04_20130 [Longimicrobiales bacterium]
MIDVVRFDDVVVSVPGSGSAGPWSFDVPFGTVAALQTAPSEAELVARLCVGAVEPARGTVEVLGMVPGDLDRFGLLALRRRTGVAFQRTGLVSNLSLRDNLILPLVFGGRLDAAAAAAWVDRALDSLGLAADADRRPSALTREVRITAAVARAALHGPELLVVEHLTAGLSPGARTALVGWCRERCGSMLLLVPGPDAVLLAHVDRWLDPVAAPPGGGHPPE